MPCRSGPLRGLVACVDGRLRLRLGDLVPRRRPLEARRFAVAVEAVRHDRERLAADVVQPTVVDPDRPFVERRPHPVHPAPPPGSRMRASRRRARRVKGSAWPRGGPALTRRGRRIRWGAGRGPRRTRRGFRRDPDAARSGADGPGPRPAERRATGFRGVAPDGGDSSRALVDSRAGDRDGSPQGPGLACEARYAVRQPGPQGSPRKTVAGSGAGVRPGLPRWRRKASARSGERYRPVRSVRHGDQRVAKLEMERWYDEKRAPFQRLELADGGRVGGEGTR